MRYCNFVVHAASGMNEMCCILKGRPDGGVGVLIRKSLRTEYLLSDQIMMVSIASMIKGDVLGNFILFGVYFPSDDHSANYCNSVSDVTGCMESVMDEYPGVCFRYFSDFNFECNLSCAGYKVFQKYATVHNFLSCDDLISSGTDHSYHHDPLGHTSLLDHLFVDGNLKRLLVGYNIIRSSSNSSDHFPVVCYFGDNFCPVTDETGSACIRIEME